MTGRDPVAGFLRCISSLDAVLKKESSALRQGVDIDLSALSTLKSRLLLELNNLSAQLPPGGPIAGLDAPLAKLARDLEENAAALKSHQQALGEITSLLSRTIREQSSDGTYSSGPGAWGGGF